jgi:hypothetical protein
LRGISPPLLHPASIARSSGQAGPMLAGRSLALPRTPDMRACLFRREQR